MIDLLLRAIWSNQDIMAYVGCARSKASEIHKEAVTKHNGYVPQCPKKVRRDAVLKVLGVNFVDEIFKINYLKGVENDNTSRNQKF